MDVHAQRACLFAPADEGEAARFLSACTLLRGAGIALTIAESPFGFPVTGGGFCAAGEALEQFRRGEPVVLSHAGMAGVRELSREDLLVRAGGGTPLAEIEEAVREAGLFFAHFDSSCRDDLTLAGLLMEAPPAPLGGAYGGLRESVLSLRLVTGGGETIHSGSRAVKDVAGYEIIGFVLGAGGRCGMIAEATLRLLPAPGTVVRAALGGEAAALAEVARRLRERRHASAAVLFGERAAARLAAVLSDAVPEADLGAAGRPAPGARAFPSAHGPPPDSPPADTDTRRPPAAQAALLYAEIHASAPGAEEHIHGELEELAAEAGAGAIVSARPFSDLRRALILDLCAGTAERQVLHVSHDDDDNPLAPPDPLGWRDCFPPRAHALVPLGAAVPGEAAAARSPVLGRDGVRRRPRVELLAVREGRIAGASMEVERGAGWPGGGESPAGGFAALDGGESPTGRRPALDADGPPAGRSPGDQEIPMFDPALDEIERRILRVFDPAGVLRP